MSKLFTFIIGKLALDNKTVLTCRGSNQTSESEQKWVKDKGDVKLKFNHYKEMPKKL